jgi:hypothetical protein
MPFIGKKEKPELVDFGFVNPEVNSIGTKVELVSVQAKNLVPIQPFSAIEIALVTGDLSQIRDHLRMGVDPSQVQQACLRQAELQGAKGQQCAKLIRTAIRIKRLLPDSLTIGKPNSIPASGDQAVLTPIQRLRGRFFNSKKSAPITEALLHYDLDAASKALKKTRFPFLGYREKHQDQLVGMLALDHSSRVKLWNKTLVMRGARAKLPEGALKNATKSSLYYSQKPERNQLKILNGRARFDNDKKDKIVCRHLTLYWLKEREFREDGKVDYRVLGSKKLIKQSITDIEKLDKDHLQIKNFSKEINHLKCKDFGVLLSTQFEKMRDSVPPVQAKRMLVNPKGHAIGLELKIKQEADGSPAYVVNFYEPNTTASHHRIRTTDLEKIKGLSMSKLVHPIFSKVSIYKDNAEVRVFAMLDKADFDNPRLTYRDIGLLHYEGKEIPIRHPECFDLILRENWIGDIQAAFTQIAQEPNADRQMHLMNARDSTGRPALFRALGSNSVDTLNTAKAFMEGVLSSTALSSDQKTTLLNSGFEGQSPLANAVNTETQNAPPHWEPYDSIAVFINTIADSSALSDNQKVHLLSGSNASGTSILASLDNQDENYLNAKKADYQYLNPTVINPEDSSWSSQTYLDESRMESKNRFADLIIAAPGLSLEVKETLLKAGGPDTVARLSISGSLKNDASH